MTEVIRVAKAEELSQHKLTAGSTPYEGSELRSCQFEPIQVRIDLCGGPVARIGKVVEDLLARVCQLVLHTGRAFTQLTLQQAKRNQPSVDARQFSRFDVCHLLNARNPASRFPLPGRVFALSVFFTLIVSGVIGGRSRDSGCLRFGWLSVECFLSGSISS